jgi:hypothetical protein
MRVKLLVKNLGDSMEKENQRRDISLSVGVSCQSLTWPDHVWDHVSQTCT